MLDGFTIVLGSQSVQFGLLMTLILCIKIPLNTETDKRDINALIIYWLLLFTHVLILLVKLMGDNYGIMYNKCYKFWMIVALVVELITINWVLG